MSKNIVVICGSPRKNGNSSRLANAFIEGAESAGKKITLFRVAEMKIGGCHACEYCFKNQGICIQKDDMPQILEALRQADALVLASPVYYFSVSAQLKLAIDRFFALLKVGMPVKRAALLIACGDPTEAAAASSVGMFRQICAYQKWEEAGVIVVPALHKPADIVGHAALEQAKLLGKNI